MRPMKKNYKTIAFISISAAIAFMIIAFTNAVKSNCPVKGSNNNHKFQHLDSLKNRSVAGSKIKTINLSEFLKSGKDENRFSNNDYVQTEGYVYLIKLGGSETCNCHSKDKEQQDIHIEICDTITSETINKDCMIVEINRYTRASNSAMDYKAIKQMVGKRVLIQGWLFFDEEHKQNAVNTDPDGKDWRKTCWEIHPCLKMEEI